jgi:hypothetical protein
MTSVCQLLSRSPNVARNPAIGAGIADNVGRSKRRSGAEDLVSQQCADKWVDVIKKRLFLDSQILTESSAQLRKEIRWCKIIKNLAISGLLSSVYGQVSLV